MSKTLVATSLAAALTLVLSGCQSGTSSTTQSQITAPASVQATAPAMPTYSAETFFDTVSLRGNSFNHSGDKLLLSSDETGIYNLYEVKVSDGSRTQITDAQDSTYSVGYFPNDDRILFRRDNGGNELHHLFVRELDGQITDLTPGEQTRAGFAGFSKDGTSFYVLSNKRDPKFMDLYKYDAKTYAAELVYKNEQGFNVAAVSPDGRFIALNKTNSNRDSDFYLLDTRKRSAKPTLLSAHNDPANYNAWDFSVDGQSLYYATDAKGEFRQLWRYDLATDEHSLALKADWDISFLRFSETGRYMVSGVNADASTEVSIFDTSTNKQLTLPSSLPKGTLSGVEFSHDERFMSFYLSSDTSPRNLYHWEIGSEQAQRLTSTLSEEIDENNLVSSEIVRFKSFDGLTIPGVLYKPKQASASNKVPALIWVHGGPGGQSRTGYSAMQQHLVNHGYAIFAVNNRGSSGYGKTFFHLDDKKHGEDDLQDIIYGKKHLQTLDWVDGDKIGIMGGSYGGYMTAAALTFTPEEFEVGINIFGVTNWVRTLTSIPPWWESFKKSLYDEMGDPATDEARHRRISPLFHAKNITKPLLVVQGANDPRVLQVESDELVAAVKANGVPVEYVLFDDEGHGFSKRENRIAASNAYVSFLDKYLKGE
ncbi:S9 family peptidase [Pseudoalteromonas sp. T1lg75]|uniref:S9 family peptidase n=1 Tax=Pseudoalteromonas sp. T1lg75 TaxID=2077102 RepID=UPI000CF6F674|nr:prolyl oligopeptidase family serine peptidase [Pseudoalteromonas sp. T1lg75]